MSNQHECIGIVSVGEKTVVCACISQHMFTQVEQYVRNQILREINGFASEYHHHVDGRDVVIVGQLLDFLQTIDTEGSN